MVTLSPSSFASSKHRLFFLSFQLVSQHTIPQPPQRMVYWHGKHRGKEESKENQPQGSHLFLLRVRSLPKELRQASNCNEHTVGFGYPTFESCNPSSHQLPSEAGQPVCCWLSLLFLILLVIQYGSSWMQELHQNQRSPHVFIGRCSMLPSCSSAGSHLLISSVTSPFVPTIMHNSYRVYNGALWAEDKLFLPARLL